MRRLPLLSLAILATLAWAPIAHAETDAFPSRPITILIPFPPGGTSDVVTRAVAKKVTDATKTSIVIDNRSGGGGVVAAIATKQAAPEGTTLFLTNNGLFAITPALGGSDVRFDPIKDFQPITPIVLFPSVLVVPAASPVKTVNDLVKLAKTKPGGLSFASQGLGSGGHILGEMLKLKTGAPLVHVPYRGAAPAMTDIAGGSIDMLFTSYVSAAGQISGGKARVIAVTTPKRSALMPDAPTMAESGFADVVLDIWHGLVAPAGMPAPVVKRLNEEFVKAAQSPEIVKLMDEQFAAITTMSPEEFGRLIASDIDHLGKVVRAAGIKIQ
jgi:tripartite-type tricarboxylate transporter receptor subunit TctC